MPALASTDEAKDHFLNIQTRQQVRRDRMETVLGACQLPLLL
jgi:hypothetical protein